MQKQFYRSIFLSDFHIGAKTFDAPALLRFLREHESQYLYLVGDIIDGWKLDKRWYWDEDCGDILCEIIMKARRGTKIFYLPGNHDDALRHLSLSGRQHFSRIFRAKIANRVVHETTNGHRFLVMHGDQFDRKILRGPLSRWSDWIYDLALDFMHYAPRPTIQIKNKKKYFSLAKYLQKRGAKALSLLNNFENAVYKYIKKREFHGLICGHTHIPVIKNINDILYANCGSWLRTGHTALVENDSGHLELIDYPCSFSTQPTLLDIHRNTAGLTYNSKTRKAAQECVELIRDIWPSNGKKSRQSKPTSPQAKLYPQISQFF